MRDSITKARSEKKKKSKLASEPVQAVEQPQALPMDSYPDAREFQDFIDFLKSGGAVNADSLNSNHDLPSNIRFNFGTINSDGRLDMCKQGFRNAFVESCGAVIKDGELVNNENLPANICFKHGTMNNDGRLHMCKQGFRNTFMKTCGAVIKDGEAVNNGGIPVNSENLPVNIRFKHGTLNSDGRLDICKQGFRNAFVETCDAVIKDGEADNNEGIPVNSEDLPVNIRFKHGTLNSDGRLDMCKQGFRNAFVETCDAVIKDGKAVNNEELTVNNDDLPVNIRFKHGTLNSDGRLDMCKQGFRNAFVDTCEAVVKDGEAVNNKDLPVNICFKHGTLNSDGRLDMCKQGFRNAFVQTCDAVEKDLKNTKKPLIVHYLIGNNRLAEDGEIPGEGDRRVAALANMIRHRPDIVTWFLAGNSMDCWQIKPVAEALGQTRAKYVWLKMNPIKTGTYHLGKMLMRNPSIELLDVFNCGLCNDGFDAFVRGLAEGAGPSAPFSNLKHLYLSINAISSSQSIDQMLSFFPQLESLIMGVNPFGDEGFVQIHDAIIKASCRETLKRLNIDSMWLTDVSLPLIEEIVKACPKLVCVELGSYKSTNYFGQKHNRFDVKNAATRPALVRIARALVYNAEMVFDKHKGSGSIPMHYLGLQHALVVDSNPATRKTHVSEAKAIIDELIKNQLHQGTGINLNGIISMYSRPDGTYSHVGEWSNSANSGGNGDEQVINNVGGDAQITNGVGGGVQMSSGNNGIQVTNGNSGTECTNNGDDDDGYVETSSICDRMVPPNKVAGGVFYVQGITTEIVRSRVKVPWPAVDYIKSIYRNTMKI